METSEPKIKIFERQLLDWFNSKMETIEEIVNMKTD